MAAVSETANAGKTARISLSNFKPREIIYKSSSVWKILGCFDDDEESGKLAIVVVNMPLFKSNEQDVFDLVTTGTLGSPPTLENEEYSIYSMVSEGIAKFPFDVKVIYPATEFHIKKNRQKELVYLRESGQAYLDVTRNYLNDRCRDLDSS